MVNSSKSSKKTTRETTIATTPITIRPLRYNYNWAASDYYYNQEVICRCNYQL